MQLTDAMKRLTDLYQDATPQHLEHALWFCAHGRVVHDRADRYIVEADKMRYTVQGQTCSCDPLQEPGDTAPPCVHGMATQLFQLLQDGTPQHDAGGVPVLERHIEKVVSGSLMSEAPYAVTLPVEDVDGFEFVLTVRKQDPQQFF